MDNDVINCEPEQTEEVTEEDKQLPKDKKSDVEIGKIMFVSCAAGSEETYLDDNHKTDELLSDINPDKIDDGKYLLFPRWLLFFNAWICCLLCCAIVCILLLEDSISDSIQPDSCEIPRRPSILKEGIIKDGISDPLNGNLFLNKIFQFWVFAIYRKYILFLSHE